MLIWQEKATVESVIEVHALGEVFTEVWAATGLYKYCTEGWKEKERLLDCVERDES